jgi:hypothetical protein
MAVDKETRETGCDVFLHLEYCRLTTFDTFEEEAHGLGPDGGYFKRIGILV